MSNKRLLISLRYSRAHMAFTYDTIATDSNWLPIALFVRSEGQPLDPLGVTVTVTVKNKDTRLYIVENAPAEADSANVGRWEFWFTPDQVHAIEGNGVWLVEWLVSLGEHKWRSAEPAILIVRKKL